MKKLLFLALLVLVDLICTFAQAAIQGDLKHGISQRQEINLLQDEIRFLAQNVRNKEEAQRLESKVITCANKMRQRGDSFGEILNFLRTNIAPAANLWLGNKSFEASNFHAYFDEFVGQEINSAITAEQLLYLLKTLYGIVNTRATAKLKLQTIDLIREVENRFAQALYQREVEAELHKFENLDNLRQLKADLKIFKSQLDPRAISLLRANGL